VIYTKANSGNIIGGPPEFLIGHIAIVGHVEKRVTFISSTVLTNSIGNIYFGNPVIAQVFKKYSAFCEALKVHYHVHQILLLALIMSQINPQHK
jgi:hypothetical protein